MLSKIRRKKGKTHVTQSTNENSFNNNNIFCCMFTRSRSDVSETDRYSNGHETVTSKERSVSSKENRRNEPQDTTRGKGFHSDHYTNSSGYGSMGSTGRTNGISPKGTSTYRRSDVSESDRYSNGHETETSEERSVSYKKNRRNEYQDTTRGKGFHSDHYTNSSGYENMGSTGRNNGTKPKVTSTFRISDLWKVPGTLPKNNDYVYQKTVKTNGKETRKRP